MDKATNSGEPTSEAYVKWADAFRERLQERVDEETAQANYQFVNTVMPVLESDNTNTAQDLENNTFLTREFFESVYRSYRRQKAKAPDYRR